MVVADHDSLLSKPKKTPWFTQTVQMGPISWTASCILDTGSEFSLVNDVDVPKECPRRPCDVVVTVANGENHRFTEYITAFLHNPPLEPQPLHLLISKDLPGIIIGYNDMQVLGYDLVKVLPAAIMNKLRSQFTFDFPTIYDEAEIRQDSRVDELKTFLQPEFTKNCMVTGPCSHVDAQFSLVFKDGVDLSLYHSRSYVPPEHKHLLDDAIKELINNDWVGLMPADHSGVELGFTIAFNGSKPRVCVNPTRINPLTVIPQSTFDPPSVLYNRLCKIPFKFMSQLDLKSAYYSLVWNQPKQQTVYFVWKNNRYMFKRMPFGFSAAPAKFTQLMQSIFGHLDWLIVYFDNLLILSETYEEHRERLLIVLKELNKYNMKLNVDKSQLLCTHLSFLGFRLSNSAISIDPAKAKAILDIPTPTTVKSLQSFIGMVNFNRNFIVYSSALMEPLNRILTLVDKGSKKKFTDDIISQLEPIVNKVKEALAYTISNALPPQDHSVPILLYSDASDFAIAGAIGFLNPEQHFVCMGVFSRLLRSYELNYTVTKKELLAAVSTVRNFQHLFQGRPTTLMTDHEALTFPKGVKEDQSRTEQAWWFELAHHALTIQHIDGKDNILADYLSRFLYPDHMNKPRKLITDNYSSFVNHCISKPAYSLAVTRSAAAPSPTRILQDFKSTDNQTNNNINSTNNNTTSNDKSNSISITSSNPSTLSSPNITPDQTEHDTSSPNQTTSIGIDSEQILDPSSAVNPPIATNLTNNDQDNNEINSYSDGLRSADEIKSILQALHYSDHGNYQIMINRLHLMGIDHPEKTIIAKKVCRDCATCQQFNPFHKRYHPALSVHSPRPWYHIQIDLIGPLPPSNNFKFILIIVDVFSSYVYLYPLLDKSAPAIVECLKRVFADRGAPKVVQSDNGSEFANSTLKSMLDCVGSELRHSSAYHPEANGKVERHVGISRTFFSVS